ncbi:uncharacterized protein FFM5_15360 [Fusarium fujikuroi]|nr:uncharacterized protein FFM5_15360 [Fusarium fujikuroi]
MQYTKPY